MYGHTIDFFFAFVKGKVGDYEMEYEPYMILSNCAINDFVQNMI